jgi:hypothetical protein
MQKAYRIPDNDCACTEPGKAADKTVPINRFTVLDPVGAVEARHDEAQGIAVKPGQVLPVHAPGQHPDNDCACTEPGKAADKTVPINRFTVRSFLTNLTDGSASRVQGRKA